MNHPDFSNTVLMQYETPLPDDFDMDSIRTRVREKGGIFDQMPGLLVKFYAVNEVATASWNEYSSIYLWSESKFLADFLPAITSKTTRMLLLGRLPDGH
jgi:hypothetical protein